MKEITDLLESITQDDIKKGAGIGAAIGALLGATKGDMVKNTMVGAGLGATIAWALEQYSDVSPADSSKGSEKEVQIHSADSE